MFIVLIALLLAAAAHSSAHVLIGAAPSCKKNDCLAVVVTNSRRQGLTQCTNFLRKTAIPPTSTTTSTTTVGRTSTVTTTVVKKATHTSFSPVATQTISVTTTIDPTSTVTITSIVTTTITQGNMRKRAMPTGATTTSQTSVPSYASAACTNTVQYSSACSCIGAGIQTTTLNAPTTTKTVTAFSTTRVRTTVVQTTTSTSTIATTLTSTETASVSGTDIVTETATLYSTVTAISPSPTSCSNEVDAPQGIQWAYYNYSGDPLPPYANFDPTDYKTMTPLYNSTWSGYGGFDSLQHPTDTIYGSSEQLSTDNFVIDHRGYFYAAQSGYHGFAFEDVDDLVDFWIGDHAFVNWDRNNAGIEVLYDTPNPNMGGAGTLFAPLEPGYHPFRMMFLQATGGVGFKPSVYDPDGNLIFDYTTPSPSQIIQYSCNPDDGAPPFPQFGSEL